MVAYNTFEENRRHGRLAVGTYASLLIHVGTATEGQAFCVVLDVSEGGLRFRTPQPPRVGNAVTARVAVAEEIYDLTGIVVRVRPLGSVTHEVALSFFMDPRAVVRFVDAMKTTAVAFGD